MAGIAGAVATGLAMSGCQSSDEQTPSSDVASIEPPSGDNNSVPPGAIPLSAPEMLWAQEFLQRNPSIDVHCHPGLFFLEGMTPEDPALQQMASLAGFKARTVADMAAGQLAASVFSTVADISLIGAGEHGLFARREFAPGEAYRDHQRQISVLAQMVESGLVHPIHSIDDLQIARDAKRVGAFFACEGGDFLEGKGERLSDAWEFGIRSIGLVHYHINEIGDIQTAAPRHGGLTVFGREVVNEMNRLGMLIDMAHATFETTHDAAEHSSQPLIVSHSMLANDEVRNPRLLDNDHARIIAQTGGLVAAWPSGIGTPDFATFTRRLLEIVELIGVDHVGLGTDMDANFKPVFTNYRQLPHIPVALRKGGMNEIEIAQVMGGNFVRVFSTVTANRSEAA